MNQISMFVLAVAVLALLGVLIWMVRKGPPPPPWPPSGS